MRDILVTLILAISPTVPVKAPPKVPTVEQAPVQVHFHKGDRVKLDGSIVHSKRCPRGEK
jgi:hypothetical protein